MSRGQLLFYRCDSVQTKDSRLVHHWKDQLAKRVRCCICERFATQKWSDLDYSWTLRRPRPRPSQKRVEGKKKRGLTIRRRAVLHTCVGTEDTRRTNRVKQCLSRQPVSSRDRSVLGPTAFAARSEVYLIPVATHHILP